MKFPTFRLEREQTLHENAVEINLTESGVHPCALHELMDAGEITALSCLPLGYGWTDGTPELRARVAAWYPGAEPANVLIANGSSEANQLALLTLLDPGDEMLVIVPTFLQLEGLARGLGLATRTVALDAVARWQLDIAQVEAALSRRTRLIVLCNPNNPTGAVIDPAVVHRLATLAASRQAWLLVDEVYRGSELDGRPAATAWGLSDRVIVTGGLSKALGCPGLRLGWLIAPHDIVAAGHARQDYTTIGSGLLSQRIAERVLEPETRERILARARTILERGRGLVGDWVARRNDVKWTSPQAAGMAFVSYAWDIRSDDLVAALRSEESVFLCAGSWFGLEHHLRIAIGVEPEVLQEGLRRLDRFLERHAFAHRTSA